MNEKNRMNILVTGGAGFIGSHLCQRLLAEGHRVFCIDNLFTGSKENITHLLDRDNFVFIEHDIIEPFFIEEPLDQIYNLACPASPVQYQSNPVRTVKANTIGVINMLGLARKHGARMLQASTSEVYGDPDIHPQVEEYRGNVNPVGPRACYDEGKRAAETLCFDYHRMHGMEIKVVRIFNTYGSRMAFDDGRVVSNFIIQALRGDSITIYGDGTQTRSFCYVDDLVGGLVAMMNTDKEILGPVNLGNPNEFSIKKLAEKVIVLTGSKSNIVYNDLPQDDPKQRCPDISKAKELFGWVPMVELEEGLEKTIENFKKRLHG
jgi:UDP-glucuronate decarboxylase